MSITSRQFIENEAWLLFQLNDEPVRTISDGDFNVLAIMDVATGLIHGMEFFDIDTEEPTEFESKKLLNSSESNAGTLPKFIFVNSSQRLVRFARAVSSMGIKIIPEEEKNLDPFTEEARVGFAAPCQKRFHALKTTKPILSVKSMLSCFFAFTKGRPKFFGP